MPKNVATLAETYDPDGFLYITTGNTTIPDLVQDRNLLAGKILCLTEDGTVPLNNPFSDSLVYFFWTSKSVGVSLGRSRESLGY